MRCPLSRAPLLRHIEGMAQNISLAYFEEIASRTVADLPEAFRAGAREVVILVADYPDAEILAELEIDDPLELTGLYEGIPMTEKSIWDLPTQPDAVWLFREPILAEWRDRGDVTLEDLITHVTIHEFAHHFGWSDAEIARIDPWWE